MFKDHWAYLLFQNVSFLVYILFSKQKKQKKKKSKTEENKTLNLPVGVIPFFYSFSRDTMETKIVPFFIPGDVTPYIIIPKSKCCNARAR